MRVRVVQVALPDEDVRAARCARWPKIGPNCDAAGARWRSARGRRAPARGRTRKLRTGPTARAGAAGSGAPASRRAAPAGAASRSRARRLERARPCRADQPAAVEVRRVGTSSIATRAGTSVATCRRAPPSTQAPRGRRDHRRTRLDAGRSRCGDRRSRANAAVDRSRISAITASPTSVCHERLALLHAVRQQVHVAERGQRRGPSLGNSVRAVASTPGRRAACIAGVASLARAVAATPAASSSVARSSGARARRFQRAPQRRLRRPTGPDASSRSSAPSRASRRRARGSSS